MLSKSNNRGKRQETASPRKAEYKKNGMHASNTFLSLIERLSCSRQSCISPTPVTRIKLSLSLSLFWDPGSRFMYWRGEFDTSSNCVEEEGTAFCHSRDFLPHSLLHDRDLSSFNKTSFNFSSLLSVCERKLCEAVDSNVVPTLVVNLRSSWSNSKISDIQHLLVDMPETTSSSESSLFNMTSPMTRSQMHSSNGSHLNHHNQPHPDTSCHYMGRKKRRGVSKQNHTNFIRVHQTCQANVCVLTNLFL
jgi:hypothetical protein